MNEKMWRNYLLFLAVLTSGHSISFAQNLKEDFKPSGHVIARGFLDYSAGLGNANEKSLFPYVLSQYLYLFNKEDNFLKA